jgi:hypothetical protein
MGRRPRRRLYKVEANMILFSRHGEMKQMGEIRKKET